MTITNEDHIVWVPIEDLERVLRRAHTVTSYQKANETWLMCTCGRSLHRDGLKAHLQNVFADARRGIL